ncbi:NAD(P)-dependent alcohol dehydrogenase [Alteromonas confluentis]|uniref:Zinc-binding dehydrogenase n=1 Tax=Alteromonas confluentis TaxID=1656094 RepID=A0A1E7Z6Q5_9ALTE|nr:NAD(P)-dependent alcohol dehydrogenase [Alteromonas confluentis]OFC69074.1 zinc-binding dehydrogenase [Alteromonas confluentis]
MTTTIKAIATKEAGVKLSPITIERRELNADDVQFDILYCGICHSDLHQIKNDFGGSHFPMVPGHEIVGRVTAVGSDVTQFKVGDLAGVGCIVDSCGHCPSCDKDLEMFCENGTTLSFNTPDKKLGGMTFGGFSEAYVCKESYTLKMPASLDLAASAPLLCAGITVYSPLKHWQAGPGKTVGIVGVGGLGHMAIKIASAMEAKVVVFTTSENKVEDAIRLGADDAVLSTDEEQMKKYQGKVDLIIDTVSANHDVNAYLNQLAVDGSVVLVGLPNKPIEIGAFNVVHGRRSFAGSNIGGIAETQEMLNFCAEHNITADIEMVDADEVNTAFERLENNDVKYRFVVDMATL